MIPVAMHGSTRHVCCACGADYGEKEWLSLAVSQRIAAKEVRRLVRDWPEALCVEVRCCARCGHTMAAKRRVPVVLSPA